MRVIDTHAFHVSAATLLDKEKRIKLEEMDAY
jgi:hypothetical protein